MEIPTAIKNDLLAVGEVEIHQVLQHGAGTVVAYTVVNTTQKRIACYILNESEFDLVVDVDDAVEG
jgi:hypothetical protein